MFIGWAFSAILLGWISDRYLAFHITDGSFTPLFSESGITFYNQNSTNVAEQTRQCKHYILTWKKILKSDLQSFEFPFREIFLPFFLFLFLLSQNNFKRFGRKITLYPCITLCLLTAITTSLVNSIWWVFALRVVMGLAQSGIGLTLFVMASECVGPKYRSVAGTTIWFTFAFALCMMSLQAYFVQNWRKLLLITSAPYVILLPTYL